MILFAMPQPLLPSQTEVLQAGLLTSGFSCILQMPTGSGKTWLAEHAIEQVLRQGQRAIYLAPLRALASELYTRWQNRFSGFPVGVFTGEFGRSSSHYPVSFEQAQLLVMTPERLDFCTRSWRNHWHWLPEVDLVVVDECHLLGEGWRGARLEGALSRLQRLNPFVRVLGLSATLGNRAELADWLNAVEYTSNWRPIALQWHVVRYRKAEQKPHLLATEVARCVQQEGKSLVFVQSRRRAEQLSQYLQSCGLKAVHHHAGLGHDQRRQVEEGFRNKAVDVVVATSTLEMGLNLPVRQVVLYDLQQFNGQEFVPLSTNSVWQRVGRAGRPGLHAQGEAVLIAPQWDQQARHYPEGRFEPIRSFLSDERALAEQIIVEISGGYARNEAQLERIFSRSLAAWQNTLNKTTVRSAIKTLRASDILYEETDSGNDIGPSRLRVHPLGRIVVRHMLYPTTVLRFRQVCQNHPDLTFFDILLLVTSTHDCEPVLPVDFEELDTLAQYLYEEPAYLLQLDIDTLQDELGVSGKRLLAALKMALAIRMLTRENDPVSVAAELGCYAFELERLAESVERLLLALQSVQKLGSEAMENAGWQVDEVTLTEKIIVLHRMVIARLDESASTLMQIKGLGPTLAKRLVAQGIVQIEDLAATAPKNLAEVPGISVKRAELLVEQAAMLSATYSANRYRESTGGLQSHTVDWPAGIDPYRLRRALELKVRSVEAGRFRITGGSDPHIVRRHQGEYRCDCADAQKGQRHCKHVLAVKLTRGDQKILSLVSLLTQNQAETGLDLWQLWFDERSNQLAYR